MKDEIKEMNLSEMLFNRDERLLDIITNLQEELAFIKNDYKKVVNSNDDNIVIIHKAIEYIKTELITEWDIKNDGYVSGSDLPADAITPLLNILTGGDEE